MKGLAFVFFIMVATFFACAQAVTLHDVGVSEVVAEQYDVTQWESYREYLGRVEHGADCQQAEFDRAVSFFEIVTKLDSGLPGAYGGRVLDRARLKEALQGWDRWYADRQFGRRP